MLFATKKKGQWHYWLRQPTDTTLYFQSKYSRIYQNTKITNRESRGLKAHHLLISWKASGYSVDDISLFRVHWVRIWFQIDKVGCRVPVVCGGMLALSGCYLQYGNDGEDHSLKNARTPWTRLCYFFKFSVLILSLYTAYTIRATPFFVQNYLM